MLLAELVCLSNQAQYYNGALLAGGLLYVYYKGRTALATTYRDPNGNVENSNPVVLDNMGRCSVYASPNYSYTLVWCDKYGQEVFSYDKELLDAVPVEDTYSIGIKGDDTISVNQSLSGQTVVFNLHAKGEDYNGIDPIVVNNDTREISANHKPLGVETPLKFVQDDEEATIIGLDENAIPSAVAPIVGPIVESAISSISGQFVYSAGDYIDITNNVISVTGDVGKTYSAGDNIAITEDNVISGKDWSGEIASAVEPKLDSSAFSSISGDFLQSGDLNNYYTKEETNTYVNSSTSGKLDATAYHEYSAGSNIDITDYTISGRDWSGEILSATSGKQDTLSAGNNIQISGNVISVSGELGKIYSGENHVVVDNVNDKIGLDETAQNAIDSFKGEFDLSAGNNIAFRLVGSTVYIDGQNGYTPTYEPIIEDL
jgi:hypothetical protein